MTDAFQFLAGRRGFAALSLIICTAMLATAQGVPAINQTNAPIPFAELGAKAGAQYQGDLLSVLPARQGARLRCDFQKLEGEATAEGLWLTSTADGAKGDRFRVVARSVGRVADGRAENLGAPASRWRVAVAFCEKLAGETPALPGALAHTGTVAVAEKFARFVRPGLVEEYSVSVDGVRQDFIIEQRPDGEGALRVGLDVAGAAVEPLTVGARLVLENSGRTIAYSRLRVTDATGKELTARMEVMGNDGESQWDSVPQPRVANLRAALGQAHPQVTTLIGLSRAAHPDHQERGDATPLGLTDALRDEPRVARRTRNPGLTDAIPSGLFASTIEWQTGTGLDDRAAMLAVVVADADAVYPVRIDPTFSDANWISMGGLPGADNSVFAAAVDSSGNLYIGGDFTIVGDVFASHIAKWNGTNWTALGSGMNNEVYALAVSGSDLYAGGVFTTAGGSAANYITKWDGNSWSALGSGVNNAVYALAVSGSEVYAGGAFTMAGGSSANYIAKWDGSSWSALGSGMGSESFFAFVKALAVSGRDVYAGGRFLTAGGSAATNIAKWNGSSWSPLGSGLSGYYDPRPSATALVVSGTDLFVGGSFTNAGGSAATNIAKWDGNRWTALGSGIVGSGTSGGVTALAVSGSDVYAGGPFGTAGGSAANSIAKWNGSSWTALGSGLGSGMGELPGIFPWVLALAVSGSDVYAVGTFLTAGGSAANNIAKWNGSNWAALSSGFNGAVYALGVSGADLYVSGNFTVAGGSAANWIAKWNGSSWSGLGSGMGGVSDYQYPGVHALAGHGAL